jgi:uncharacterized protein
MNKFAVCWLVVLLTAIVVVSTANADLKEDKPITELLAEQGYAGSQTMLGLMYYDGDGVPQNYNIAAKWFRLAAEQGYAPGQALLGAMYYDGNAVPQNYKIAAKWFRLAAEQGIGTAQYFLGTMYAKGEGVLQNYKMAHMYFNISAANGHDQGGKFRNRIADLMTTQQIADAQQMANEWMAKH